MSQDASPEDFIERIRRRKSKATAKGGQADLHTLVPDGDRRTLAVIDLWGLRWPEADPN